MIKILFEDEHLLALDKPPGLVVAEIPGMLVHRLDKDTSGVLLVAKTQSTLENLQAQFKERIVKKEYLALVHGHILERGKVEGAVGRNPWKREKFMVSLDGKQAVTEYEPLRPYQISNTKYQKVFPDISKLQLKKLSTMHYELFTLLRCHPRTGRTHQIRVHLKYIGHPIVSDDKYVGRKIFRLDKRWCPRMFLHASRIGFKHPTKGEWMEIESELAEDLKKTLWIIFSYNWPSYSV